MGLLNFITQGCDQLSATAAPSITAMGLRICISLATIMLVWFGVQEALASAQGGAGFSMARFVSFFVLITFAYTMVKYYDSAIPGVGSSLKGFINGGAQNLVGLIGTDSTDSIMNTLSQAQQNAGPGMVASFTQPYLVLVYAITQILLALFSALTAAIIGYGAIASTIIGLLGPIFIPFLVFDKLEFLFWGWLKAYLSFAFYKVVAAACLSVLGHVITAYYTNFANANDPVTMVENFPLLLLLIITNIFILLKIPALTASIFSGSSSGHDGGMGMITTAIAAIA
jgi:hypothetical protein